MGRSRKMSTEQIAEARLLLTRGEILSVLADKYGVTIGTLHRHVVKDNPDLVIKNCSWCNDPFVMKGRTKFCDDECRKRSHAFARKGTADARNARNRAITKLIAAHPEEFSRLCAESEDIK